MGVVEHGTPGHATALAERAAARLIEVDGVVAVVLGGSRATGHESADSDVDLGVYYRSAAPPARSDLDAVASDLDDERRRGLVTRLGDWGPWVNGGAWTRMEGIPVDWLFRSIERVASAIEACRAGRFTRGYSVGHPHGFHSTIYAAEVDVCVPLEDPAGAVAALKRRTRPFPAALRRQLMLHFLFEAQFSCENALKPAARCDVAYVTGCLYRSIACLAQVIFALNERYCFNEKGAVRVAASLEQCVPDLEREVARVLQKGDVERALRLVEAVRALVP